MTNFEKIKKMTVEEMAVVLQPLNCSECENCGEENCADVCKDMQIKWLNSKMKEQEEQDEIFLLSIEEYEKYKENIPHLNTWWWLRSQGDYYRSAACVNTYGYASRYGSHIYYDPYAIRPALKYPSIRPKRKLISYGVTWVGIDNDLAIAEIPIGFEKFDDESNDYETSYIRKWLLDWIKEREDWENVVEIVNI